MMNSSELLDWLRAQMREGLEGTLGIEIGSLDGACLEGRMTVSDGVKQPFGMLHGGALAAFAESLASCAGMLQVEYPEEFCVGTELSISYLRGVESGVVVGRAEPLRIGRLVHVWRVTMKDEAGQTVCEARVSLLVRRHNGAGA
jgi:uncharacterized protein (TIGR00369 family)